MIEGTSISATVTKITDGDTIRAIIEGQSEDESLRILALDTEESLATSSKPVTPWGKEASKRAQEFFSVGDEITIEFPGNEDVDTCLRKYRGNYCRLLVYVHKDGVDFQETMIREGYSPYFVKYGNAAFDIHHKRYQLVEREAQEKFRGVWDQISVNGSEIRNYAALGTWWQMRAAVIDEYRRICPKHSNLFNSRLDFEIIKKKATLGETVTVFTELRSLDRISFPKAIIKIGSVCQPFSVLIPDITSADGQRLVALLESRYIAGDVGHPRRSYAYVTGKLSLFNGNPQIEVGSPDQITDGMPE